MADFAGILLSPPYDVDRTYRRTAVNNTWAGSFATLGALNPFVAGDHAAGAFPVPSLTNSNYAGRLTPEATCGFDWFERMHILPRTLVDFGNIITTLTAPFEAFNAYRATTVSFNAFTNGAGAGVSIPGLPAVFTTLPPFTSILSSSTTRLNPVRLNIVVTADGPPSFDSALSFLFGPGGVLAIRIRGSRISLFPFVYEAEFTERWVFPSDDSGEALSGAQQVLSLTANPTQAFGLTFLLDAEDRQRMQSIMFGAQAQLLALPLWHEEVATAAALSIGATSATVTTTTNSDFRAGGLAVIFESPTKFDVVVLASVSSGSLSFTTTPLLNAYGSAGVRVAPVRLGFITNDVGGQRSLVTLERFQVSFQVTDNDTGMFAGSTAGWSTFGSRVLLDDPNVAASSGAEERFTRRVRVIDNSVGAVRVVANWPTNRRQHPKSFTARGRAGYRKLKQLLLALRGPQKSFYIPTFAEDLTVVAPLVATETTFDVTNVSYTRFVQAREPKAVARLTFTDGTTLVRTIVSTAQVSASVERLTIDVAWPANRTVDEIVRVEFLELSRFAADTFTFQHRGTGAVTLTAPVKTLIP